MKALLLFGSILFMSLPNIAIAQEQVKDSSSSQLYSIKKNDNTEYIGKILKDDGREVLIETETLGKIYIAKSDIKSMIKIQDKSKIVAGEYVVEGPFTTRYCFTTNALSIKKGENYTKISVYGPEVHFALTDNFSLGFMSTWIGSPLMLAAKYSFKTKNEKVNYSVGTLMGSSGYLFGFRGFMGLHFANITYGSRKSNITFSGGYTYFKTGRNITIYNEGTYTDLSSNNYGYNSHSHTGPAALMQGPIASVAGIFKVGAKASLIFDSMFGSLVQETTTSETTQREISPYIPATYGYDANNIYREITPSVPAVIEYTTINTKKNLMSAAIMIMPGMRFQSSARSAVQVSLAGVTIIPESGRSISFPVPMLSGFYKF